MKVRNAHSPVSATVGEEAFAYLAKLPKAVLIDCYCQLLALNLGDCDAPVPLSEVKADVEPMLRLREET